MRWVLAFDESCGTCREMSRAVATACAGRLEVLPLTHSDVQRWREQRLGPHPRWAPTLIQVKGAAAKAWTGSRMALPLLGGLGVASSVRVLRVLGGLSGSEVTSPAEGRGLAVIGRKQFFRLGAGVVAAAGLLMSGGATAQAREASKARRWAEANAGRLPERYDEVIAYPLQYRRAIFGASSPAARSRMWTEQLRRCRQSHSALTSAQAEALDRASAFAVRPSNFTLTKVDLPGIGRRSGSVSEAMREAFGAYAAAGIIGVIGNPPTPGTFTRAGNPDCFCNIEHNYACWGGGLNCNCNALVCCLDPSSSGCGPFWVWVCDGACS